MLRTKGGDENSYKSSDEVNNIDWSALSEGSPQYTTMEYYKGLIDMRKGFDIITDPNAEVTCEEHGSGLLVVTMRDGKGGELLALINPYNTNVPYVLEDAWNMIADSSMASGKPFFKTSGTTMTTGISVTVFVNDNLAKGK